MVTITVQAGWVPTAPDLRPLLLIVVSIDLALPILYATSAPRCVYPASISDMMTLVPRWMVDGLCLM